MTHICMIGCGNMGGALMRAWQQLDNFSWTIITRTARPDFLEPAVHWHTCYNDIKNVDILILGIKPQQFANVLPALNITPNTCIVSIAAGQTVDNIQQLVGTDKAIVRTMPNTPSQVGLGITGIYGNDLVTNDQQKIITTLFTAVGKTYWLNDETLMDAVTALAGSGPAYVFAYLESMQQAAVNLGLPTNMASDMALQTVLGAASLADQSDENFTTLRQNVTSKGGTTAAGLSALLENDTLDKLAQDTLNRAHKRSQELST